MWTTQEKEEYQYMRRQLDYRKKKGLVSDEVEAFILRGYEKTSYWRWSDSDGCSVPKWLPGKAQAHWPTRYFPPCVAHDRYCLEAYQMQDLSLATEHWEEGNRLFELANKAFGLEKSRTKIRAVGVWIGKRSFRIKWKFRRKFCK